MPFPRIVLAWFVQRMVELAAFYERNGGLTQRLLLRDRRRRTGQLRSKQEKPGRLGEFVMNSEGAPVLLPFPVAL